MENKIFLYKVKWNMTSPEQPYFLSTASRDGSLTNGIQVPLKSPNLNFKEGLDIDLTLPVDFTVISDYNFVKIIYNEKSYYAYITDYKQVSVGFTEIFCHRAVLYEHIDYLSLFTSFNIKRQSLPDNGALGRDTKFITPEFRQYRLAENLTHFSSLVTYRNSTLNTEEMRVEFVPFLVITLDIKSINKPEALFNYYGFFKDYQLLLLPLEHAITGAINSYLYGQVSDPHTLGGINEVKFSNAFDSASYSLVELFFTAMAAYIKDLKVIMLPCGISDKGDLRIPFYARRLISIKELVSKETDPQYKDIWVVPICSFGKAGEADHLKVSYTPAYHYGDVEINIFGSGNSFIFKKSDFISQKSKKLDLDIYYFFNGSSNKIVAYPYSEGAVFSENKYSQPQLIDIESDIELVVSASSNFNAQNKYYKYMTAMGGMSIAGKGMINALTSIRVGKLQEESAPLMHSVAAQLSGQIFAKSNYLRAGGQLAGAAYETITYLAQRHAYAQNEKAKPDTLMLGEDGESAIKSFSPSASIVEWIPFPEEFNQWLHNSKLYGEDCFEFTDNIDIRSRAIDGKYFVSATAILKDGASIDTPSYLELISLLNNGCIYKIV